MNIRVGSRHITGLLLIVAGILILRWLDMPLSPGWPWYYVLAALSLFVVGLLFAVPSIIKNNAALAAGALILVTFGLIKLGAILGNQYAEQLLRNEETAVTEAIILRRADIYPMYPHTPFMDNRTPCMLFSYTTEQGGYLGRACTSDEGKLPKAGALLQVKYVLARPDIYTVNADVIP